MNKCIIYSTYSNLRRQIFVTELKVKNINEQGFVKLS